MKLQDRVDKSVEIIDNRTEFLLGDIEKIKDVSGSKYQIEILKTWVGDLQYLREILLDINEVND
jgi:hypothetical protein